MQNTNATNFRKNIYSFLEQAIKYNEPINVATKDGNAIILSEDDYNDIIETLAVYANPKLKEDIIKGMNTLPEDCVAEEEVEW